MIMLRKPKKAASKLAIGEVLSGTVDGVNRTFTTLTNYASGKIFINYNGQTLHSPEDFIETAPGEISLLYVAPRPEYPTPRATYEMVV